jgi:hypothetical protein
MNRITGISAGAAIPGRSKATAPSLPSGFSVEAEVAAPAVQESQPAQNVGLSGMLALQEAEAETVQDKTARRHGMAMLGRLSQLQKSLLSATADDAVEIETLASLAREMPETVNPGLTKALAAIRLRAKIELIRRGIEIT